MVRIRPLEEPDRATVERLITAHFAGDASYDVVTNDESEGVYARVAERDGEVVGVFALTEYGSVRALGSAMHLVDTTDPLPQVGTYGLVHMGYVAPSETGRGVGSTLLARLHALGEANGVDAFVSDAWFHGGPDTPRRLLTNNGYEVVYTEPMDDRPGDCPKCPGVCVCEAALTVRLPPTE